MVHLDANYLIQAGDVRSPAARPVKERLEAMEPVGVSTVAWSEFLCGPLRRSSSLPDCLIAATAIRCDARLATVNILDFEPFVSHGLLA